MYWKSEVNCYKHGSDNTPGVQLFIPLDSPLFAALRAVVADDAETGDKYAVKNLKAIDLFVRRIGEAKAAKEGA